VVEDGLVWANGVEEAKVEKYKINSTVAVENVANFKLLIWMQQLVHESDISKFPGSVVI
jgi:hypothetical protein